MRLLTGILPTTLWIAATAAILQPVHAQPAAPPSIRVTTRYTLRSDRAADMAAAIKEYNAVLKKAMWDKPYTIWRSQTGPTQMLRVDYHQKFAELDANIARDPKLKEYQAEIARISTRITESFLSSERVVYMVNQELSLPRTAEPPKMIMVWTAHVKEGKMREAIELEKNEYSAAVKSAGFKAYTFATARFGAPNNEIRSSVGLDNWAALDEPNPIRKAMGPEKYRAFTEKMNALLDDYRYEVFRYDSELSYAPPK